MDAPSHAEPADLFAGDSELAAMMRAKDWAQSPLGPPGQWPESLKTCVRIMLTSRQPMFVWWGDQLINLYNDAYKAIVGGKHPEALGQPASVVWREIWDQVGPRAETAMRRNEGTYDEALLLIMERYGYPEETYYTFSYSPVPNDRGGTGGIICANTDDTQRIIGERQLALLRELGSRTAEARRADDACRLAAEALETNRARPALRADLPARAGAAPVAAGRQSRASPRTIRRRPRRSISTESPTGRLPTCCTAGSHASWPEARAHRSRFPRARGTARPIRRSCCRSHRRARWDGPAFWSRASIRTGFTTKPIEGFLGLVAGQIAAAHRQRRGLRGGTPARRGAGRDRPRQDRFLLQCLATSSARRSR